MLKPVWAKVENYPNHSLYEAKGHVIKNVTGRKPMKNGTEPWAIVTRELI